jgi:hypothetical protein
MNVAAVGQYVKRTRRIAAGVSSNQPMAVRRIRVMKYLLNTKETVRAVPDDLRIKPGYEPYR